MSASSVSRFNVQNLSRKALMHVKEKHTAPYFTITLSLFTLSFFGLFAIRPTLITGISLIKKVSDLRTLNLAYEEKIGTLLHAQNEYQNIREALPGISAAIPSQTSFPELVKRMEEYADRHAVDIQQLQLDAVGIPKRTTDLGLQTYGFHMTALGEYPALLQYLRALSVWKRLVTIRSFDITAEGSTKSGLLRLSLQGKAYYYP